MLKLWAVIFCLYMCELKDIILLPCMTWSNLQVTEWYLNKLRLKSKWNKIEIKLWEVLYIFFFGGMAVV